MDKDLETLKSLIDDKETELAELKTQYKEQRMAGLKAAMETRTEANKLIEEELRKLGYRSSKHDWTRFYF